MSWPDTVRKSDLRIEWFNGSGAGGQRRNKRKTACRMTHLPTGKVATCQEHAHGHQNLKGAFMRLVKLLTPLMTLAPEREQPILRRVRNYSEKHGVRDEREGDRLFDYNVVLHGDGLQSVIEAVQRGESDE